MMRWSEIPRAVAVCSGLVFGVVAFGCAAQSLYESQILYPSGDWTTDLPAGVSSDPVQFVNALNAMPLGDSLHYRARPGRCALLCTVPVKIQTLGKTWQIYPDTGPATGRAVARIENQDPTDSEGLFGFLPSQQAEYVFWVDRDPRSSRARLTVLWIPRTGGSVKAGFQKDLILCHPHPSGYVQVSDVDFYEYKHRVGTPCAAVASSSGHSVEEASLVPMRPFVALYERVKALIVRERIADGAWIDCNSGCCT